MEIVGKPWYSGIRCYNILQSFAHYTIAREFVIKINLTNYYGRCPASVISSIFQIFADQFSFKIKPNYENDFKLLNRFNSGKSGTNGHPTPIELTKLLLNFRDSQIVLKNLNTNSRVFITPRFLMTGSIKLVMLL